MQGRLPLQTPQTHGPELGSLPGSKVLLDKKFSGYMNLKARSVFLPGQGEEGEDGGWKG